MPPSVHLPRHVLNHLGGQVGPSVVTVSTYDRIYYSLTFTTGFIIFSDETQSLICVDKSVLQNKERMFVHFNDGSCKESKVLLDDLSTGHVVLMVDEDNLQGREQRKPVCFRNGGNVVERKDVFLMAKVETFKGFNLMSGSIINPICRPVGEDGNLRDQGSRELFSFSCPAMGREKNNNWRGQQRQIIGAAVFDQEIQVIGTVESLDEVAYDLKFAMHTSCWLDELNNKIKAKDSRYSITRS